MKILIISATQAEIEMFTGTFENLIHYQPDFFRGFYNEKMVDIRITGAGIFETAHKLGTWLDSGYYDLLINAGICGSFRKDFNPGRVLNIVKEIWGDFGAEDQKGFLDAFELGLLDIDQSPYKNGILENPGNPYSDYFNRLPVATGLTVNKVNGNSQSIKRIREKYDPDIETMEGAAVSLICLSRKINFQCIRSISNFVEPRNRSAWETGKAIENLCNELNRILREIKTDL